MGCRLLAGTASAEEQEDARRHLASCASCRRELDAFREVDRVIRTPVQDSSSWEKIRGLLGSRASRNLKTSWLLLVLGLVQAAGGIFVLIRYSSHYPLEAGLGGGILLGDSGIFLTLGLWLRMDCLRIQDATRDWESTRREWQRQLGQDLRTARWGIANSALLALLGSLHFHSWTSSGSSIYLAIGTAIGLVGLAGLWIHRKRASKAQGELEALKTMLASPEAGA